METHGFHDLVRRAQGGDPSALDSLHGLVRPYLLRVVAKRIGPPELNNSFEDLLQETWIVVHRKIGKFRGGAGDEETARKFQRWAARIARTTHLNRARSKKTRRHNPPTPTVPLDPGGAADSSPGRGVGDLAGHDPTPSKELGARERKDLIEQALLSLDSRRQTIVRLRIFEDLPFEAIAQRLGCDESTVRHHFHEVLKELQPRLMGLV